MSPQNFILIGHKTARDKRLKWCSASEILPYEFILSMDKIIVHWRDK